MASTMTTRKKYVYFVIVVCINLAFLFLVSIACYKKNLNFLLYNLGRDNLVERFKVRPL
jgi:hypothetical protein